VSIGVARHLAGESLDDLFKRVDEALYRAKNSGRNKVLAA
jgi:PleD family two-component response regulator